MESIRLMLSPSRQVSSLLVKTTPSDDEKTSLPFSRSSFPLQQQTNDANIANTKEKDEEMPSLAFFPPWGFLSFLLLSLYLLYYFIIIGSMKELQL